MFGDVVPPGPVIATCTFRKQYDVLAQHIDTSSRSAVHVRTYHSSPNPHLLVGQHGYPQLKLIDFCFFSLHKTHISFGDPLGNLYYAQELSVGTIDSLVLVTRLGPCYQPGTQDIKVCVKCLRVGAWDLGARAHDRFSGSQAAGEGHRRQASWLDASYSNLIVCKS